MRKISSIGTGWIEPVNLARLYRDRDFRPVFVAGDAGLKSGGLLLDALDGAPSHGLYGSRFRTDEIDSTVAAISASRPSAWGRLWGEKKSAEQLALLDALLVDRYLAFAHELSGTGPESRAARDPADEPDTASAGTRAAPADTVLQALEKGPPPPVESWAPTHPQYAALRRALAEYRGVVAAGGWPTIEAGETVKPFARGRRVTEIRARLDAEARALGRETPEAPADPLLYDDGLLGRVRDFQESHALDADGAVGKGTVAEMNVTAPERLRQIEVALERWRRGPRNEPPHRVEVNVPGMMVYFFHAGEEHLELKTVVGSGKESPVWKGKTSKAETPELVDNIETIEINPRWYIPEIIVRTELLAKEKKKPGFLDKGGYEWYEPKTGRHGPASEIPEADWANPAKRLNLRQKSGQVNSLGRIKFVFHNRYAVYLHDTPEKNLFRKGRRNFSHGCVRVENPSVLAESLLAYSSRKAKKPVADLMADTTHVVITLKPSVPIHLVYRTVWVDRNGDVHFLPDLYHRDPEVEHELLSASMTRESASFTGVDATNRRASPP